MKKFIIINIFIFFFMMFSFPSYAEPKAFKEGFYTTNDLNLPTNVAHTVQNISANEAAFIAIFDSNQITRQFIKLTPQSEKYILIPIEAGYQIIIIGKEGVVIS